MTSWKGEIFMNSYDSVLQELTALQKQPKKRLLISVFLPILLGIAAFLTIFPSPFVIFFVFILFIILLLAYYGAAKKQYTNYYKSKLVTTIFKNTFQNLVYEPARGFDRSFIAGTGLVYMGNEYSSEDYISGEYKGVSFQRSDVTIEEETTSTDSEGNTTTSTTTYFSGRWFFVNFNKNFSRELMLVQKGFSYANEKKGIFTKKDERRHAIEFENEAFNKVFSCYCQDDQEAFYLITPQIMESLLAYSGNSDGKILIGFKDNVVHIAIDNRTDMLEPHVLRAPSYERDIRPVEYEVSVIQSFIDLLNLDRNIFR